jgi:DNA modification methylase/ParB-like chromosome segregation protein Spo0J
MLIVKIEEIKVNDNRQRQHFDDAAISALANSISNNELLHPPVVRAVENGYELIAGERRLRAIVSLQLLDIVITCNRQQISPGYCPVTLISDLNALQIEELELDENVLRESLSVTEYANAVARLHKLRQAQNPKQTLKDTARELSKAKDPDQIAIRDSLMIAENMNDPLVAKAKTRKEAIKIIEKKAEAVHRAKLAEQFQVNQDYIIHAGSVFDLVSQVKDSSIDLIVTDPPYGVDADSFGTQATTTHNYADTKDNSILCYNLTAREGFRVTKPTGAIYVFMDILDFPTWKTVFADVGWIVWPKPLIWVKNGGMLPKPDFGPRYTYETILYAYKPEHKTITVGASDTLIVAVEQDKVHAAQKPVALYSQLIQRSAKPNSRVLDFFAGSGTIFEAAFNNSCNAVGFEAVEANINICKTRINALGNDPMALEALL